MKSQDKEIDKMLDTVLTVQYNLVTTNDLKSSLAKRINGLIEQSNNMARMNELEYVEKFQLHSGYKFPTRTYINSKWTNVSERINQLQGELKK